MPDRDPQTGQFAKTVEEQYVEAVSVPEGEVQEPPDAGIEAPVPEPEKPQGPPMYEVLVDGEKMQVTLDELRGGYQRQQHFSRSMASVKERELELDRRELELRRGQADPSGARNAGRPQAGLEGWSQWAGPSVPSELGAWNTGSQPAVRPLEQPNAGITPRASAPYPGLESADAESLAPVLGRLTEELRTLRESQYETQRRLEAQDQERIQEAKIADLGRRYPDFDRGGVEEALYKLNRDEYQRIRGSMDRSTAYEMLHLRMRATKPGTQTEETQTLPPVVEAPSRSVSAPAPTLTPPKTNDRDEMVRYVEAINKSRPVRRQ